MRAESESAFGVISAPAISNRVFGWLMKNFPLAEFNKRYFMAS
jgi:hypothetical protein